MSEAKNINEYTCSCGKAENVEFEEFKNHLLNDHGLDSDQMKGSKQMIMHMDGADYYSSSYAWTLESGLTFTQYTRNEREPDDPMRFEY